MTEQELREMFLVERIGCLIEEWKEKSDTDEDTRDGLSEAERYIDEMEADKARAVRRMMDEMTEELTNQQQYLYIQGVMDGVRIMKRIQSL